MIDWFTPLKWDEDADFVSKIHIGEEKKNKFLKTLKKYRMADEEISKINLALSLLPYESFKHLLSNEDCLRIVHHGGGRDSLFNEKPVEAPKFLADLVERSKTNPEIKKVFCEAVPSARITLLLMGSFLGRDAGESDVTQLLSSFKKLREFKGSLEEMIYQDVETLFLNKEIKQRDQLMFLSQMCCVRSPIFQNAALQVLEQNKNNFITWHKSPEGVGVVRLVTKGSLYTGRVDLLPKTANTLFCSGFKSSKIWNGQLMSSLIDSINRDSPVNIQFNFGSLKGVEAFSTLNELQKSIRDEDKLKKSCLQLFLELDRVDEGGIDGFSLFKTLPLKESLLLFKEVEKFDEKIKDSHLSIRDSFYFMPAFCGVCGLVSKVMEENGAKSLSELKGHPQMESFYSFKKIADQRIGLALKSNKVNKSQVESMREIIDQFGAYLEKEHLLSLAKKHDKAPQQKRINKI